MLLTSPHYLLNNFKYFLILTQQLQLGKTGEIASIWACLQLVHQHHSPQRILLEEGRPGVAVCSSIIVLRDTVTLLTHWATWLHSLCKALSPISARLTSLWQGWWKHCMSLIHLCCDSGTLLWRLGYQKQTSPLCLLLSADRKWHTVKYW